MPTPGKELASDWARCQAKRNEEEQQEQEQEHARLLLRLRKRLHQGVRCLRVLLPHAALPQKKRDCVRTELELKLKKRLGTGCSATCP